MGLDSPFDGPVDRIVGGKFAPKPVPWQVSVRADAKTGHWCGGTILDKNTILSAGKENVLFWKV